MRQRTSHRYPTSMRSPPPDPARVCSCSPSFRTSARPPTAGDTTVPRRSSPTTAPESSAQASATGQPSSTYAAPSARRRSPAPPPTPGTASNGSRTISSEFRALAPAHRSAPSTSRHRAAHLRPARARLAATPALVLNTSTPGTRPAHASTEPSTLAACGRSTAHGARVSLGCPLSDEPAPGPITASCRALTIRAVAVGGLSSPPGCGWCGSVLPDLRRPAGLRPPVGAPLASSAPPRRLAAVKGCVSHTTNHPQGGKHHEQHQHHRPPHHRPRAPRTPKRRTRLQAATRGRRSRPGRRDRLRKRHLLRQAGEAAARVLTKGWLVAVHGRLDYHEWETDDGTKRHDYQVDRQRRVPRHRVLRAQSPRCPRTAAA